MHDVVASLRVRLLIPSRWLPPAAISLLVLLIAVLSLLLPYAISNGGWTWLVWGREILGGNLDLTGGAGNEAFHPLPVLFTTVLSLFGDAAPPLWLALTRAAWLLALVAGYRVGNYLGGRAAGIVSAAALVLIPVNKDGSWLTFILQGTSEPLIVACVLWGVDRYVHGHRLQALILGCLAALGRPEAGPLVVAYAMLIWREEPPPHRTVVAGLVASVPILWIGGGLWGAGDPLVAAHTPQGAVAHTAHRAAIHYHSELIRYAHVLIPTVWLGAGFAWVRALVKRLRGDGDMSLSVTLTLGLGALSWILIIIADGIFLGLPLGERVFFGPQAILSVLAGPGIVQVLRAARGTGPWILTVAIVAATVPYAIFQLRSLAANTMPVPENAVASRSLNDALGRAQAPNRLARCGRTVFVRKAHSPPGFAQIAWKSGIPISAVHRLYKKRLDATQGLVVLDKRAMQRAFKHRVDTIVTRRRWLKVSSAGTWRIYEAGCGRE